MISSLTGSVRHVQAEAVVIEVGGVGLLVQCGARVARELMVGEQATLATSLVVREDSLTLYGFVEGDARDTFETLQSVSGVGPRLALAVLSALSPNQLRQAVHSGNEAALIKVSGIGRKGAQRMILELADRLGPAVSGVGDNADVDVREGRASGQSESVGWQDSVRAALISLGWSAREAEQAVANVVASDPPEATLFAGPDSDAEVAGRQVSTLLTLALRSLGKR